jgi:imidazolonepropionase
VSSPGGATSMLFTGIAELVTNDPTVGDGSPLGILHDAALVVDGDGTLAWLGPAAAAPAADERVDVAGRAVIPGFVDSHTHLVFAGDRASEFEARMSGVRYDGGGIMTTVAATAAASESTARRLLAERIAELRSQGTTTVEIKSGYSLDVSGEERALRLAREVTAETTFLGAHVVPRDMDRDDYIRLVTGDMLRACAPVARWIDVFCEPSSPRAFNGEEAREILSAGAAVGLGLRLHGNQLAHGPGVRLAVELEAASVDHCTWLDDQDVDALSGGVTVATLLPGVEWSTRSPFPDARRLIDAGVTVALATDCNPGTCASSSMSLMIALAVREMGMTSAEALWAATAGGAAALRRDDIGVLSPGRRADVAVIDAPSHAHMAYRPGVPLVSTLHVASDGSGSGDG